MPRRQTMLLLALCAALLSGCAQKETLEAAATAQAQGRKPKAAVSLKSRCGQPTNWTAEQKRSVAAVMEREAEDPGMQLLAQEWDRETKAIRICREGKGK